MKLNTLRQTESHNGSTGKEKPSLTESLQGMQVVNVHVLWLFPNHKLTVEELSLLMLGCGFYD